MASALSCRWTCRRHRLFNSPPACVHTHISSASKHFRTKPSASPSLRHGRAKRPDGTVFSRQHSFPTSSPSCRPFFISTFLAGNENISHRASPGGLERPKQSGKGGTTERTNHLVLNNPPHLPPQTPVFPHLSPFSPFSPSPLSLLSLYRVPYSSIGD